MRKYIFPRTIPFLNERSIRALHAHDEAGLTLYPEHIEKCYVYAFLYQPSFHDAICDKFSRNHFVKEYGHTDYTLSRTTGNFLIAKAFGYKDWERCLLNLKN